MDFIDLKKQYQAYKSDIDTRMQSVIDRAGFINGPEVAELEEALADYVGMPYAVGCASGTDALLLALLALGIGPGDEVIVPAFSFIATAEVIPSVGARPVFVDIDERTYTMDVQKAADAITDKTRAMIAVDLYGQCADYQALSTLAKARGIYLIEDAAQSFGAEQNGVKACAFGDIGCTSFFPAKPLGCFGDGGMVFTSREDLYKVMKALRVHGASGDKYAHEYIGLNSRLDTLQAAILLGKWPHFAGEVDLRQEKAAYYTGRLANFVTVPYLAPGNRSVYGQYSIRVQRRDELQSFLQQRGIPTAIHYPIPMHRQKAFLSYAPQGGCPVAEAVAQEIISLPMHPFLTEDEQNRVCEGIEAFYK